MHWGDNYWWYFKMACMVWVIQLKGKNHFFFSIFLNKFLEHVLNVILKLNNKYFWKKFKV